MSHAAQICALSAPQLEEFVDDWIAQRIKEYCTHELWRGTGDMGRDVTGYVTARRLEGDWDNFQCKQLTSNLSERSAFVELGKIFMHAITHHRGEGGEYFRDVGRRIRGSRRQSESAQPPNPETVVQAGNRRQRRTTYLVYPCRATKNCAPLIFDVKIPTIPS